MTLTQVWGALLIFIVCPLLGGLPLIAWIVRALTGHPLTEQGTGNLSVSAAFYHGGRVAGSLAVLSEAAKGIAAVGLARSFFPLDPAWQMIALIALVVGRYWFGKGAGTTNVVWGYVAFDWVGAALVFLIGGIGFTVLRERQQGKFGVLVLFPLITLLRYPQDSELIGATIVLAALLAWIYHKIPDDLDLAPEKAQSSSQSVFRFFRGDRAVKTLDQELERDRVGQKAATLAQLRRAGYPVPMGWVLAPGDDPELLVNLLRPSPQAPLIVRSSAVGEDSETASAAGQYETIQSVTRPEALTPAISRCFASYDEAAAQQYRRDRHLPDAFMAVLVQPQIQGVFSGVAFSRDPIRQQGNAVVIEALPGDAARIVSGQVTPDRYRVHIGDRDVSQRSWVLPDALQLEVEGGGDVPPRLIQQVAFLARHLEAYFHGIPQDVEWSYDGKTLWLLQSRPITTLLPIWTRKIAAEVIPGVIHPLTWSINRPLTCGVWGDLFTVVLAQRASGLDFNETATLHYSHAYFNATLLGQLFRRMGLPPESLEFLTRGEKFSRPPLRSTLKNLPGLLRLWQRELRLESDFRRDHHKLYAPAIAQFQTQPADRLDTEALLQRIAWILDPLLRTATYYSILAPLSAALRKAVFRVKDDAIDYQATPEVAALRSLQALAGAARQVLTQGSALQPDSAAAVFGQLRASAEGRAIVEQFDRWFRQYGYLSEVGTDIAVPTWNEDPAPLRELFAQFCLNPLSQPPIQAQRASRSVQRRFDLKGRVTELYSRLLAELRGCFVALESRWLQAGILTATGDIFFLTYDEIERMARSDTEQRSQVPELIRQRRSRLQQDSQLTQVPNLVYGSAPPLPRISQETASKQLQGIGASPGQVEGWVKVVRNLTQAANIHSDTILVVPYTDSGWAALLARATGLISEVGGQLSHGAIVAREYRIPAVMDIPNATQILRDGQHVRIDGQQGIVEILEQNGDRA